MHSEDDDFNPYPSNNSSKKLASLFESDAPSGGNSSLMYKAPKQPRPQKQQQIARINSSGADCLQSNEVNIVICVTTVQAFKLENNEYKTKGKTGATIVVKSDYSQYQLLLYTDKSDFIAQTVINSQFWFTVQANNYVTFYDKHKILWSILFENSESAVEFITQISIAKWSSDGKITLAAQDLVVVDNEKSVESEMFVDLSYTVSLLSPDNKIDKKVEYVESEQTHVPSNIEASALLWQSAIIGMKIGTKRLIMLPGSQLGRWKKYVPDINKNYCVLLTVNVNRIENLNSDKALSNINMDLSAEQNVKTKSESIKDAMSSSPNSSRANLISRMAKMGQPTLPFKGARVPTSGVSDSSETEEDGLSAASLSDSLVKKNNNSYHKKQTQPVHIPNVTSTKSTIHVPNLSSHQVTGSVVSIPSTIYSQQPLINPESEQNMMAVARSFTPYDANFVQQGAFTSSSFSSASDTQLSTFLSELRMHNTELRMNINRVSDKVDRVVDKVDNIEPINKILDQLQSMEQNMLSQFLAVNKQNTEMNSAIMSGTSLSFASTNSTESNIQYEVLKKENLELLTALSQSRNELSKLEAKLERLELLKSDFQSRLVNEKENRTTLEKELTLLNEKLKNHIGNQENVIETWHKLANKTAFSILNLEKKVQEIHQLSSKNNQDDIKKLMRNVFKRLLEKFPHNSTTYHPSEIHSGLADVIKASTLEFLQSRSISNNNNTVNKVPTTSDAVTKEVLTNKAPEELKDSVREPICQNEGDRLSEPAVDVKETNNLQKNLVVNEEERGYITGICDESTNLEENISAVNNFDGSSPGNLKNSGNLDSTLNIKPSVTEFLKMKDEIVKTVENDLKKDCSDANKESTDGCCTEGTREVRQQSPCSSAKSNATNDTVDDNWRLQPPPLLFDEEEKDTDDDWLKM